MSECVVLWWDYQPVLVVLGCLPYISWNRFDSLSNTLRWRTCLDKSLLYVYNAICHHGIFPLSSKCSHFFQLMESQNPAWDNPADIVNVIFLFCTQEKQLLEWFCYDRLWIYSSDCIQEGRRCLLFLNGLAHWSGLPSGIKLNSWMTQ